MKPAVDHDRAVGTPLARILEPARAGSFRRTQALSSSRSRVREILDPVLHIDRVEDIGNQLQIANGLANGNTELVSVDDAGESRACLQTPMRDFQQILVLSWLNSTRPSDVARSKSGSSSSLAEPSSSAVSPSTPRLRNPAVMAEGT
jgi:hypothetical protein